MGELLVKSRNIPGRLTSGCTRRLLKLAVFLSCWWAAREPNTLAGLQQSYANVTD